MSNRSSVRGFLIAVGLSVLAVSCDRSSESAEPIAATSVAATQASVAAPTASPPFETFKLEPWTPGRRDVKPVEPPAELIEPWRVFVNQERPRQKKNPRWRSLPAREAVELEMAKDGSFRCIVNPLEIKARPTEDDDAVAAWVLVRSVLCSGDGWKTWTESPHVVVVLPDGKRQRVVEQTEVFLREPIDGKVRETTILMRSDKRQQKRPPPER